MSFEALRLSYARTWKKTLRRPVVLSFSFVQPLMWMLFFGFLFERYEVSPSSHQDYLSFLAPGVCTMTVLFGASQSGIGWIRDMQTGFLERLLGTPSGDQAFFAGKILADVTRLCVQALIVLGLALLLGAEVDTQLLPLGAALLVLALFATAFSCLSCAIAFKTRAQEAMAVFVHIVNMPLLFTSTALVPRNNMPDWLASASAWNPLTKAVDTWRGAVLDSQYPSLGAWLLTGSLAALLYGLAAILMRGCSDLD